MQSTTISLLAADLERDEGRRGRPYKDSVGKLTIGVGHNLDAEPLCKEAIDAQLAFDIRTKVTEPLDRHFGWCREHPEDIQRALGNLIFNLGTAGLARFTITLGLIQARAYTAAARSLLSNKRYHAQIGKRLDRIASLIRNASAS